MIGAFASWAIFGFVVGAIARLVMPGRDKMGCFFTIMLGVIGSLIGGTIGSALNGTTAEIQPAGFIGSLIGSVLFLWVLRRAKSDEK